MTTQTADQSMVENFKTKVRNWWTSVESLRATKVPADKQKQKDSLLSRAETIRKTIKGLTSWSDTLRINELGNVGFLPLIPVAVIGGAVAAIGYWVADYAKFAKTINYQDSLVKQGVPVEQAAMMANKMANPEGLMGGAKTLMFMGGGILILYFYLKNKR